MESADLLPTDDPGMLPLRVVESEFIPSAAPCSDAFTTHELEHVTTIAGDGVRLYESNGAGLAVNDLDNDGDLDLVLANLDGPTSLLWNEGDLRFRRQQIPISQVRSVLAVDIDGDGWQDLIFAQRNQLRPRIWRNPGASPTGEPALESLTGVRTPYSMTWADMDRDGDLDLIAATYDAELATAGDHQQPFARGGVIFYENVDGAFQTTHLSHAAQTLALLAVDLDEDGRLDILAGNDFFQPDLAWYRTQDGWQEAAPFAQMTENTMSFDAGDIDNDGALELLATDMMPYAQDAATEAAWAPLMEKMAGQTHAADDPQIMANVLQVRDESGNFTNQAQTTALERTGWSWSSKFGDLNHDGLMDIYVVNGMQAEELFPHLPDYELIEENQAFRNVGQAEFAPAAEWALNSTAGGRSMSMADFDLDGDLDIVVNNLMAPAHIFENRHCEGESLEVDLYWPQSGNARAIGAVIYLDTGAERMRRDVRAASGYLSGDPARVHFGFPQTDRPLEMEIVWPDGRVSHLDGLEPDRLLSIERPAQP